MIDFTPLLRLYARYRTRVLGAQDAVAAQPKVLAGLVRAGRKTRFGRDHDFGSIATVADFQTRVPLRRYEDFWRDYWQPGFPHLDNVTWPGAIKYFATTSGTTSGHSKYIPYSSSMRRSNARAGLDLLVHHALARPDSHIFGGKSFMLGGSTDLVEEGPGIYSGDLSGITSKQLPGWFRRFNFPPLDVALISDWEEKLNLLARLAPNEDIRALSGTPSWVLLLIEKQEQLAGAPVTARDIYPHLELVVHGGVNFKPYRRRYESFLDGLAELREVYPTSEGFIAVQDKTPEDGLRLIVDNGLFFEFVPVEELDRANPTRHTVESAVTGHNYAVVLTNCAGCWSYVLGDTVRFVSKDPPRIMITGRTSYSLSAFGEHLIGEEIETAVAAAAEAKGITVVDFSVGPVFPDQPGEAGRHLYILEFEPDATAIDDRLLAEFKLLVDQRLQTENQDYAVHRAGDKQMEAPQIIAAPHGTFAAWMKARGRMGGQNKVPRVINDLELLDDLARFAQGRGE